MKKRKLKKKKRKSLLERLYSIQVELPTKNGYRYYLAAKMLTHEEAEGKIFAMQEAGIGGRLLKTGGAIEKEWGSAARVAAAAMVEKKALLQ